MVGLFSFGSGMCHEQTVVRQVSGGCCAGRKCGSWSDDRWSQRSPGIGAFAVGLEPAHAATS